MPRTSKQKQAILKVVKGTMSHPDAEWIYEQVRQEIPSISLGTVYRDLKLLQANGKILRLGTDMPGRFDGNTKKHYHVRCDRCGAVYDIYLSLERKLVDKVARETGFKVTSHHLIFDGLCQNCA